MSVTEEGDHNLQLHEAKEGHHSRRAGEEAADLTERGWPVHTEDDEEVGSASQ